MPINENPPTPPYPLPPLLVDPKPNMSPPSNITSSSSSTSSSTSLTTKSKANHNDPNSQACAVCKYQRRRCSAECPLAQYFPPDNQQQFLNAHRLFGVRNILRIIKNLDPDSRHEAMRSIIFQSNARAFDPVGGCYRIVSDLQQQIERESLELGLVQQQLAVLRGDREQEQQMCYEGNVEDGNGLCYEGNVENGNGNGLCYEGNVENGNGLEMEMLSLEQRGEEEKKVVVVDEGFNGVVIEDDEETKAVEAADFINAFTFR